MNGKNSIQVLEKEIADLEYRLRNARTLLTLARPEGARELPFNGP
jgi:urease accessory protein